MVIIILLMRIEINEIYDEFELIMLISLSFVSRFDIFLSRCGIFISRVSILLISIIEFDEDEGFENLV